MLHYSERLVIGEMLKNKRIDTPMSTIDFLDKEGLINKSKLIDLSYEIYNETLSYDTCVLLIKLFAKIECKSNCEFNTSYKLIRFLETNDMLNISKIKEWYKNFGKENNIYFESEDK